jgi:ABC-type transport system involved in multi-copper enzyme maturation permease subunit
VNLTLVRRLVVKDWYLSRLSLGLIAAGGILSVAALYLRTEVGGFVGLTAAFITTILLACTLPMQTVVNERKRQNLAFVMSLPISSVDYTTAKIAGSFLAFIALWLVIAGGAVGTVWRAGVFGGVIPVALVAALSPFVAFALILFVAIVFESEVWAIVATAATNVSYSFLWFFLLRIPGIVDGLKSPVAIWSRPLLVILAGESAAIVVIIALTFFIQSRKRDFI